MTADQEYDYIVVGGGTAGPVVARRLAEYLPESRVLLIEAGTADDSIVASNMAMGWEGMHHSEWDWKYTSQPIKQCYQRQIHLPRGRLLGGSSAINGTLMLRGAKYDYDRIEAMGNLGWSWDQVLPFFKNAETYHPHPDTSVAVETDPAYHGQSGPLHTSFHPIAPISEKIVESFLATGLEWKPDMFSTGETQGVGHVPRTVYQGTRTSGADFVRGPNVPCNLVVQNHIQCLRVRIEENERGEKVAKAVECQDTRTGFPIVFTAHHEIILSCGAYNSPVVLMHSGIGPKDHLTKFNIPIHIDNPAVGSNLQDHIIIFNFFQVSTPQLTNDHLVYGEGTLNEAMQQWMQDRSGILSRFPFGAFVFQRLDAQLDTHPEWQHAKQQAGGQDPMGADQGLPHVEYFWSELYGGGPQHVDFPEASQSAFALITMLLNPKSRGTVRLNSRNPLFPPLIDHNYLDEELDLVVLAEANKYGAQVILHGQGTKDVVTGPWPPKRTLPTTFDGWKEYVRQQTGTCYHASGTCAMGPSQEPTASSPHPSVVDARLKVHGVQNLRVADVSVLPYVNTGHTQAPAFMIGEKAAFLIAQDAGAFPMSETTPPSFST